MVKKKSCVGIGFKHNGRCYKYKAEVYYPDGKQKVIYSNKLSKVLK